ncbi:MAG: glycoside hydrolase family 1 protein [Candidatus Abyssubacteria bacterium]
MTQPIKFPDGFLWGTATSAHQVEGGNRNNDWWQWEQRPGTIADGSTSETACDHYNRFQEDFDLIKNFGHNAHRLSIEWSRLEPQEGLFSSDEFEHYRRVLLALHERGIQPMVTLHHFTNPLWLSRIGGWENPRAVECFVRYARAAARELGPLVQFWNTINEPAVYAHQAYIRGNWPPGSKSLRSAAIVLTNMLRAHALAYHAIHENSPASRCRVGIAKSVTLLEPLRPRNWLDKALARWSDFLFNHWFLDAIETGKLSWPIGMGQKVQILSGTHDFIGVNYYTRRKVQFRLCNPADLLRRNPPPPNTVTNDLGWEIYPEGLYKMLMGLRKYQRPIYITENGCADARDALRPEFLRQHLTQMHRAITEGADVRGYFHWSLLDNFEWTFGLTPRFGLVEVDYRTQARAPRPSAHIYSRIARENRLDPEWFR